MPVSPAVSAYGTFIKRGNGASPEAFTTIAEVLSINGPSMEMETIDVTTHSTGEPWRQFVGGLLNAGEVSFDINFVPTDSTHNATDGLLNDMTERVQRNFQILFPDADLEDDRTTWEFTALVTSFQCTEAIDDVIKASVTLKLTGKPTLE